jgi:hypothetical protein
MRSVKADRGEFTLADLDDWKALSDLLYQKLKSMTGANVSLAENNCKKFAHTSGLGICLWRTDCRLTTKKRKAEAPLTGAFQASVQCMQRALADLNSAGITRRRFLIRYYSDLGRQAPDLEEVDPKLEGDIRKEAQSNLTRLSENLSDVCFLCVYRPDSQPPPPPKPVQVELTRDQMDDINKSNSIRYASTNWDPLLTYAENDPSTPTGGLLFSLLERLKQKTDKKFTCRALPPTEALRLVKSGDIDCAIGFVETPRRLQDEELDFVALIYFIHFIAVAQTEAVSEIISPRDLASGKFSVRVRTDSGSHDVARDLLGIPDQFIEPDGGLKPETPLFVVRGATARTNTVVISDGVTYKKLLMDGGRRKLAYVKSPLAVLRSGFIVRKNQPRFVPWFVDCVKKVVHSKEFKEEELALKHYRDFIQPCWIRNAPETAPASAAESLNSPP